MWKYHQQKAWHQVYPCGKSFVQLRKNESPNTEPCETSAFTKFQLGHWPFKTTLLHLLWRNHSNGSGILPFIPLFFSLYKRPSCQTLSNTLHKSKKTPRTSNDGLAANVLKYYELFK